MRRPPLHLASVFATAALVALLACSGSSSSSSGATPDQACSDYAQLLCDKLNTCAPYFLQGAYGDMATCVARAKIDCVPSFSANGTSATPDAVETCIGDAKNASCDDLIARKGPPSCNTKPGQLADGAVCGTDAQCKGALCRFADTGTCGACSSPGGAGAACARDGDCADGQSLRCVAKKCVTSAGAGADCSAEQPCLPSLACTGGKCATPLAAGAACQFKIGENPCDTEKGYYCNPKTNVCAQIVTAAAGAQCGYFNDALVSCTGGSICRGADPTKQQPGTCQAPAADGAACNDATGPSCLAPARCLSGVCTVTDPTSCK